MICLFANPLVAAVLAPRCFTNCLRLERGGAACCASSPLKQEAELRHSSPPIKLRVAKQPHGRSLFCGVAHLSSYARPCRQSSTVGAEPMKHLSIPGRKIQPQTGCEVSRLRALALRSFAAGSSRRASRVDSCRERSQSRPTIQVLFCLPEMWRAHGRIRLTARIVPAA
jgi:hypothetical protein